MNRYGTMDDESALLIPRPRSLAATAFSELGDHHDQFCRLVGIRPLNHPHGEEHTTHAQSLYTRAKSLRRSQSCTYMFTATLINTLLLSQVVLGAVLTGLGASNSSGFLITIFGALNTIIAGVVAFLKSRGQPMRARMFRDDLSRVVDEIENSAVMWYGISQGVHGYHHIDTDDQVTVRGEVARLTRLYDKAVKTNTINDPDTYNAHGGGAADSWSAGLRKGGVDVMSAPPGGPTISAAAAMPDFMPAFADPDDDSPASKAPKPSKTKADSTSDKGSAKADAKKAETAPATPAALAAAPSTPAPASPAAATALAPEGAEPAAQAVAASKVEADVKPATAAPPAPSFIKTANLVDPDESPASSVPRAKREGTNSTLVDAN